MECADTPVGRLSAVGRDASEDETRLLLESECLRLTSECLRTLLRLSKDLKPLDSAAELLLRPALSSTVLLSGLSVAAFLSAWCLADSVLGGLALAPSRPLLSCFLSGDELDSVFWLAVSSSTELLAAVLRPEPQMTSD